MYLSEPDTSSRVDWSSEAVYRVGVILHRLHQPGAKASGKVSQNIQFYGHEAAPVHDGAKGVVLHMGVVAKPL